MKKRKNEWCYEIRKALTGICAVLLIAAMLGACGGASSGGTSADRNSGEGTAENKTDDIEQDGQQESESGTEGQDQGNTSGSVGSGGDGPAEVMEVHFLDVGQGDCTLIKCGDAAMLIDAGEADRGTAVQNYLTKQGIEKLDYLVLTHPDSDHIGAAPVIITKFDIDKVLMSNFEKDNSTYRKLIQALDDKRLSAETPEPGNAFSLGSAVCTVLGPVGEYDNPNDTSVVLLVENGGTRFLFTGDAEEDAENDLLAAGLDISADVYKAGHHGSKTSSGEEFLEAVSPAYAVVSCGEGNSYGHPHARTLNSLRAMGVKLYRTDEQGSLTAVCDGGGITWNVAPSETWQAGEPGGSSNPPDTDPDYKPGPDGSRPAEPDDGGSSSGTEESVGGGSSSGEGESSGGAIIPGASGSADIGSSSGTEEAVTGSQESGTLTYVLNSNTYKFHRPSCGYLPSADRVDSGLSREEIIAQGYEPCKRCNP